MGWQPDQSLRLGSARSTTCSPRMAILRTTVMTMLDSTGDSLVAIFMVVT